MEKKKYPECDKMQEVANVHTSLMEFTEWLADNGYHLTHYERKLQHINASDVVYQFMNIDPKKVEQERRQMLANLNNSK